MTKSVEQIKREIAETRERVHAQAKVEVEAEWQRKLAESAQDEEVSRAIVEVGRERREAARAREAARVSVTASEEDEEMAVATTEKKDVTPFTKESQLGGRKKPSAAARIKAEAKAVSDRKAAKSTPKNGKNGGGSRAIPGGKGEHPVYEKYLAQAKKQGVRVAPTRGIPGFKVILLGENHRVLGGVFDDVAAAKRAASAAGLTVKETPAK